MKTVMGIFPNMTAANTAFTNLVNSGFDRAKISAISKDANLVKTEETGPIQNAVGGAATGAVTGGAVGGLAGILMAAGTLSLPGLGALLIGGPLVAALGLTGAVATAATTAITGAAAGGLIGALTGLGMPEETAKIYSQRLSEGSVVLSVDTEDVDSAKAEVILQKDGADGVVTVSGR